MLTGITFFSKDPIWVGILTDFGAEFAAMDSADIYLDTIKIPEKSTSSEVCALVLNALEREHNQIIEKIVGDNIKLTEMQKKILLALYKFGALNSKELNTALGYSKDADTHAAATAIYSLRNIFWRDIIKNRNGKYTL
ncbi:hypothetical protein FACS18945_4490 [Bacteroidia bacterium]|nr:hypothetical protein FACS18945_4490 [Bacteroidia bacterium]